MTPDEKLRESDRVLQALIDEHHHGHVRPMDCNCVSTIARAFAKWALIQAHAITEEVAHSGGYDHRYADGAHAVGRKISALAAQIGGEES